MLIGTKGAGAMQVVTEKGAMSSELKAGER